MDIKGHFHAAILAASDKAQGLDPEDARTDLDTTTAQDAAIVPEGIADLLHPAAQGHVLNGTGIGSLRHDQLRDVTTQFPDFFRIAQNLHTFFYEQGAGGRHF